MRRPATAATVALAFAPSIHQCVCTTGNSVSEASEADSHNKTSGQPQTRLSLMGRRHWRLPAVLLIADRQTDRQRETESSNNNLWPWMLIRLCVASRSLMKYVWVSPPSAPLSDNSTYWCMERYAALRSSALMKCQSSNSASRVYAALLTDGPLNFSDASVSKWDEILWRALKHTHTHTNTHARTQLPTHKQMHIGDKKQYTRPNFILRWTVY